MFGFGELSRKTGNEGEIVENTQRALIATREASRAWTGRIMTLSSAIIAFSVSVASLQSFQSSINTSELRLAWSILLGALVVGAFNLLFESRIAYASTLVSQNIKIRSADSVSLKDRGMAFLLVVVIFLYPIFPTKKSGLTSSKIYLLVENWLYSIFGIVFLLETITFTLFIIGLIIFLNSFNI